MRELSWQPDLNEYETVLDGDAVRDLLDAVEKLDGIDGDIVECGSWRGGSAMIIAEALRRRGDERRVYACDSYEGFDLAELNQERDAGRTQEPDDAFASTSLKYVQAKIRQRRLDDHVIPIKGYFETTLPTLEGPFALALIDCDLHASILYAATALWPKLSPGATMLFDDYLNAAHFSGARDAIERFRQDHQDEIAESGLLSRLYLVRKLSGDPPTAGSATRGSRGSG